MRPVPGLHPRQIEIASDDEYACVAMSVRKCDYVF